MLKRGYYCCTNCDWKIEKGKVDWGLVELAEISHPNHIIEKCGECGSLYRNDTDGIVYLCPECNAMLEIVTCSTVNDNKPEIMGTPYKVPIHSDSLAIMPDQVEEHKKLFPNIPLDDENRPVFTNTKDHHEYLNKFVVVKQVQKTGRSNGKIYSYPGCKCS